MVAIIYKTLKSIVPCVLLTLSIGFCYAFSLFLSPISECTGFCINDIRFAFCLNILFLGLGAAFFGRLVEKNIKVSALVSTVLLVSGLALTQHGINCSSLSEIYLGFGVMCGISEGVGYITPVLNNILWWGRNKRKGLVAAISIISFGLGSTVCSALYKSFQSMSGINSFFFVLAAIYGVMCIIATLLIDKPKFALNKLHKDKSSFDYGEFFSDKYAMKSWLYMFLNISMGLILIGSCAPILKEVRLSSNSVIVVMMLCGIFNGFGRLLFPFLSDYMKRRQSMLIIVLAIEILVMIPPMAVYSLIPLSIIICNATYGSFFALLPSVLSDHYGNKNLSTRHGLILSSWGFASLFAYVCTFTISRFFDGYYGIVYVLAIVYALNTMVVLSLGNSKK